MDSLKAFIKSLGFLTEIDTYSSFIVEVLIRGIPVILGVLFLLIGLKIIVNFELKSFFRTIFNLVTIKNFIKGKLEHDAAKDALTKKKLRKNIH